jgi:hypothetical protein
MQNLFQSEIEGQVRKKGARVTMQATARVLDNPFEGWTTIEEAAQLIGREKATIRGWANKGWVSCFYVGRKVRVVNIDEVREFSEKHSPPKTRLVDKNDTID